MIKSFDMDNELIKSIEDIISQGRTDCEFISDEQAALLIQNLAIKFSFDIRQLFMWAGLNGGVVYDYSDDFNKWESVIKDLLVRFDEVLFLTITDEEFYPWKVLKCNKHSLMKLWTELRFFEYFIFDVSMSVVLFDTHHNSLILFE